MVINFMATIAGNFILACWMAFFCYWLASARRTKTNAEKQNLPSALAHRLPLGLSYVLLADGHLPPPMNQRLIPPTAWLPVLGAAVCLLGLFVAIWARRTLADNWSSDVTFKQGHELIRTGPYRFARHPIYTGLLGMGLGTALAIGQWRGVFAWELMAVALWIKLNQEERLLLRHFPEAYPAYQKQVKALVPFLI